MIPIYPDETLDDLIIDNMKIIQKKDGFRFSIDAVLLSNFVKIKRGDRVLDLGTGTGVIPLLLSSRGKASNIEGIEIQQEIVEMTQRSILLNSKEKQINIRLGNILNLNQLYRHGEFNVIVSNPPYFDVNRGKISSNSGKSIARQEVNCDILTIIEQVNKILNYQGRFSFIYPSSRFSEVNQYLVQIGLKPTRCRFIHSYIDRKAKLVLVETCKGSKSDLEVMPPLIIYDSQGVYTQEVKQWYGGKI